MRRMRVRAVRRRWARRALERTQIQFFRKDLRSGQLGICGGLESFARPICQESLLNLTLNSTTMLGDFSRKCRRKSSAYFCVGGT
jgi:hypothetical protein